ncbi:PREDICTED: zinc finger protein CONSTANS-LIKE 16-like isoform X2 [Lupinus angustifolius]|uniref:zinc finger protein CONSTANS-LIKE 16-like isoform X2 n=1 Tax=Lupinus angustifolius TaxID=3871 RepID=UPI00092E8FA8|nr:PREDICTED: zinc finger protein CONSTANS-LIKE 16-like isoform X2 [Lupinus angustifolius]
MSSSTTKNVPNPVSGKTARACDSCITKRARWYCAADDAFLCQACDSFVHYANPLARRHERLRLKTASFKFSNELNNYASPSWHHKKARTPRQGKQSSKQSSGNNNNNPFHLVPEVGFDEVNSHDDNEEQLLYRVPRFEPLCSTPSSVTSGEVAEKSKVSWDYDGNNHDGVENMLGSVPSDIELAEFAADVESLLGKGLENECIGMEELGLVDTKQEASWEYSVGSGGKMLKFEEEERNEVGDKMMMEEIERETYELSFHYDISNETSEEVKENDDEKRKKILLQLDYDAVISAWNSQKCPWTNGDKPNLDSDECWPHCMGSCGKELHYPYGGFMCHSVVGAGDREARVSRYREKRRTRLFSKKIRYEVRKLNAEKRPRMKGRFVKRASFEAPI